MLKFGPHGARTSKGRDQQPAGRDPYVRRTWSCRSTYSSRKTHVRSDSQRNHGFLFASGGGEANEAAIRMARRYTGRHKILTQYRSYHGGTTTALTATGDFRRWFAETGTTGFVKIFNPQPFGFIWGDDDAQKTETCLAILDEQINMEGPGTIAAIMLESIVGAGGALVPPRGYMEGVR